MSVVGYDRRGSIGVLRLNAPPVNAITFALLEDLRSALRRANADADVRGLVITGEARHFSAGADVNLFREITGAADAVRTSRVFQEEFQEVKDSPKPVVAAMAGHVTGGALELALACNRNSESSPGAPVVPSGGSPDGTGGSPVLPTPDGCLLVRTRDRVGKVRNAIENDAGFAQAERILAGVRPEIIAPSRIVDAVLGLGFPDFRGGVLKYAHDLGLATVQARIEKLAERWGERFSAGELRCN